MWKYLKLRHNTMLKTLTIMWVAGNKQQPTFKVTRVLLLKFKKTVLPLRNTNSIQVLIELFKINRIIAGYFQ